MIFKTVKAVHFPCSIIGIAPICYDWLKRSLAMMFAPSIKIINLKFANIQLSYHTTTSTIE